MYQVRRIFRDSKKKKNVDFNRKKFKYGLEETRDTKRALDIDVEREDTEWADSLGLEFYSLMDIDCFEFKPSGTKPPDDDY